MGVQVLLAERYRLDELLGRGAMGDVWRATDQVLGRGVAVKLLRAEEATDSERFRLEARTAGSLNHPNLVGVYDFGAHGGQLYLVMELVDGWSLAQERSLRGVLPPGEVAAVGAQLAAGLAAAHRQGVIHRDVKPANVMLTTDGTAKITDFGIARFADEAAAGMTATGKVLGTADYLAPERALGRPAQPAVDVYSLGCVLYELLTGQPPFRGATSLAVVQQHVDAAPVPPARLRPETPRPLSDFVLRLLAKDPAARPTAEEAAAWLAGVDRRGTRGERADAGGGSVPGDASDPGRASVPSRTSVPGAVSVPPVPAMSPPPPVGVRASRSRRRGRGRLAVKAGVGAGAVALFAGAAALGASLNAGDGTPSTPVSPTPTASAPTRADQTPTAGSPAAAPSTSAPPAKDPGAKEHHKGKGKGKHGKGDG
ncbi:serine/threonine-protein kinase [Streptomyces sp. NPDC057257]|uniref:serine/threonine-protein kinase n=1 Tax=Streptomyces sp. NPDC057257 TaxID=3346071 RepID=UPI003634DAC0